MFPKAFSPRRQRGENTALAENFMKTIPELKINLPAWPAERIVREAVLSWNLRQTDSTKKVNPDTLAWSALRQIVLAFLRHRLTDYDQRLNELCRHNVSSRDGLAQAVAEVAWKIYPWMKEDPRPFSQAESERKFLNVFAAEASLLQTIVEHLRSAIADLSRQPSENRPRLKELKAMLRVADEKKQRSWNVLTEPDFRHYGVPDADGAMGTCHTMIFPHFFEDQPVGYYFFTPQPISPNYYKFLSFACPKCRTRVVETKRTQALGQGKRAFIQSCFCVSRIVFPPPDYGVLSPTTLAEWTKIVARAWAEEIKS